MTIVAQGRTRGNRRGELTAPFDPRSDEMRLIV